MLAASLHSPQRPLNQVCIYYYCWSLCRLITCFQWWIGQWWPYLMTIEWTDSVPLGSQVVLANIRSSSLLLPTAYPKTVHREWDPHLQFTGELPGPGWIESVRPVSVDDCSISNLSYKDWFYSFVKFSYPNPTTVPPCLLPTLVRLRTLINPQPYQDRLLLWALEDGTLIPRNPFGLGWSEKARRSCQRTWNHSISAYLGPIEG